MEHARSRFEPELTALNLPPVLQNVMAAGGVGIVLGIAGLCALPFVAEPVASEYLGRGGTIVDHGAINTWGFISTGAGCALSILVLIGGMGSLRFKRWARPIMLGYGALSVLLGLAGIYFHILILKYAQSEQGAPEFATRVSALAEWVAWVVGTIFGAWVLWVMTRPGVKAAFETERSVR